MSVTNSFGSLITKSLFDWIKDKKMLTYLAITCIILVIMNIFTLFSMSNSLEKLIALQNSVTPSVEEVFSVIGMFLGPFMLTITISSIILFILSYFIIKRSLELNGLKAVNFSVQRIIMLFILEIASCIVAVLSIFRLKWLAVGVAGAVLLIIGIVLTILSPLIGILLLIIGLILCVVYAVIVIINTIRLSLGGTAYIEEERGIMDSLKISWDLTKANVLGIVIIFVVVSIIIGIISWIVALPATFFQFSLMGNFTSTTNPALLIDNITGMFINPVYLVLLIPGWIISAYQVIVTSYLMTSIYALLKKEGNTKEPETYKF